MTYFSNLVSISNTHDLIRTTSCYWPELLFWGGRCALLFSFGSQEHRSSWYHDRIWCHSSCLSTCLPVFWIFIDLKVMILKGLICTYPFPFLQSINWKIKIGGALTKNIPYFIQYAFSLVFNQSPMLQNKLTSGIMGLRWSVWETLGKLYTSTSTRGGRLVSLTCGPGPCHVLVLDHLTRFVEQILFNSRYDTIPLRNSQTSTSALYDRLLFRYV